MDPVRGRIRFAMGLACASAALSVLSLALLAQVLHALLAAPGQWPWPPMLALLGSTVAAYVLRQAAFNQSHYAAFRLEVLLRSQLAAHVARLPLGRVQALGAGPLAKVMFDDVKALHVFVADSTPLYARAYAAPLITLAALLWLDWRLALAALAVPALGFAVMGLLMRKSSELNMNERYNAAREQVAASIVEFVQAMPVVRTFDSGSASFGRYQAALAAYLAVLKVVRAAGLFGALFHDGALGPAHAGGAAVAGRLVAGSRQAGFQRVGGRAAHWRGHGRGHDALHGALPPDRCRQAQHPPHPASAQRAAPARAARAWRAAARRQRGL